MKTRESIWELGGIFFKNEDLFSKDENDIGLCDMIKHYLTDEVRLKNI